MNEKTKQVRDALLVLLKSANDKATFDEAVKDIFEENSKAKHDNPMVTHWLFGLVTSRTYDAAGEQLNARMPELSVY